jgi:hypothetical protein
MFEGKVGSEELKIWLDNLEVVMHSKVIFS